MEFAFGELISDIGKWLLIGIFLAGIITVFISPEFIETYLGDGIFSMVVMLAIATPLYVCATSSTPIAAALALKGLSPGAALVFLLAGPATNIATLTVVSKVLGKKATVIYLVSIIICSFGLGLTANALYAALGMEISSWVAASSEEGHGILAVLAAIGLLILIARPYLSFSRFVKTAEA